jgi:hypothetical protein
MLRPWSCKENCIHCWMIWTSGEWGRRSFGNVNMQIRRLQNELDKLRSSLDRTEPTEREI